MGTPQTVTVGKVYDVEHRRKGRFRVRVEEVDDTDVRGVIVEGTAEFMTRDDAGPGDAIALRRVLCTFSPVEDQ